MVGYAKHFLVASFTVLIWTTLAHKENDGHSHGNAPDAFHEILHKLHNATSSNHPENLKTAELTSIIDQLFDRLGCAERVSPGSKVCSEVGSEFI